MDLDISKNQYLKTLDKTKPIVCAVSGGVDSIVLFDLLKKADFKIIIAHINHHKRKESEMEEKYLKDLAQQVGCQILVRDFFYQGDNFQAEAHNERYQFFYELYEKYQASAIVTAHHADDNLETIIMNLIKGSNLAGYAGINAKITYQDALVIRPLINTTKDELYAYAKENNLTYFEDSSNYEDDYFRNRIRNHLVPLFKQENPSLSKSISNYSEQLLDAFDYIRSHSVKYWHANQKIRLNDLKLMHNALKKDLISYLLEQQSISVSKNKLEAIIRFLHNDKPNITFDLNNDYEFVKTYDEAYLKEKKAKINFRVELEKDGHISTPVGEFYFQNKNSDKTFKIAKDELFPLTIRTRKNGDILKIRDGHKKLKDFCIDKKIPLPLRNNLVIVTNREGEIIWVINYYQKKYDSNEQYYLVFEEKNNE